MRMLSHAVREACEKGRLPIVLAGNCGTAVGTLAGLPASTAVAWFDAHGDFNTPETTTSGFLDGTAVAIITGRCWKQLAETVGFRAIPDERVFLIGTRDLDSLEGQLLADSNIDVIEPEKIRSKLARTLNSVGQHADQIYVHPDLDVLILVAVDNSYSLAAAPARGRGIRSGRDRREFRIPQSRSAYDPATDTSEHAGPGCIL